MAFDNTSAQRRWGEMRHPLYQFVFETLHADLDAATVPLLPTRSADPPDGRRLPALA
jgi:hypothetical protein